MPTQLVQYSRCSLADDYDSHANGKLCSVFKYTINIKSTTITDSFNRHKGVMCTQKTLSKTPL